VTCIWAILNPGGLAAENKAAKPPVLQ